MNQYLPSLGFEGFNSEKESALILREIEKQMGAGQFVKNEKFQRGATVIPVSKSTGLYVYGRFTGSKFTFEYYFPFVIAQEKTPNDTLSVSRHTFAESYSAVCDELKAGVSLIFHLENVLDYLAYIENAPDPSPLKKFDIDRRSDAEEATLHKKEVSLSALALEGTIIMPLHPAKHSVPGGKERFYENLMKKAQSGDEAAIEKISMTDLNIYTSLTKRIGREDILTIVDTSFMPVGIECDQYMVVGEIKEVRFEANNFTGEEIVLMQLDCNGINCTTAIARKDLLGEPAVGRRFRGQIWLQGFVWF